MQFSHFLSFRHKNHLDAFGPIKLLNGNEHWTLKKLKKWTFFVSFWWARPNSLSQPIPIRLATWDALVLTRFLFFLLQQHRRTDIHTYRQTDSVSHRTVPLGFASSYTGPDLGISRLSSTVCLQKWVPRSTVVFRFLSYFLVFLSFFLSFFVPCTFCFFISLYLPIYSSFPFCLYSYIFLIFLSTPSVCVSLLPYSPLSSCPNLCLLSLAVCRVTYTPSGRRCVWFSWKILVLIKMLCALPQSLQMAAWIRTASQ